MDIDTVLMAADEGVQCAAVAPEGALNQGGVGGIRRDGGAVLLVVEGGGPDLRDRRSRQRHGVLRSHASRYLAFSAFSAFSVCFFL
jgi:hypothetical protein